MLSEQVDRITNSIFINNGSVEEDGRRLIQVSSGVSDRARVPPKVGGTEEVG